MRKRVVITGLGCVSPLGNDVTSTWQRLLNGVSGAAPISSFDASEYKCQIAAEVKDFDGSERFGRREARRMDRYTQFTLAAAGEALQEAGLPIEDSNRDRIGAVIGSAIGGIGTIAEQYAVLHEKGASRISPFLVPMMLADTGGGMTAIQFGLRGPNMAVVTACATGTNAIGEAAEIIRRGQADAMLAGGSEAAIQPITVASLAIMTALTGRNHEPEQASRPFDRLRDGFLIGEGSAVLVLESLEHARSRGARILAEVSGYGSTNDAFHITAPHEDGHGAATCMRQALADAHLGTGDIQYINAHGTSTPLNDSSETMAIKKIFGETAYEIPVSSTKSMTGHLLGASGALEALICVKVLEDGIAPATINYEHPDPACDLDYIPNEARPVDTTHTMTNSFGFGGHNATLILSRFDENGFREVEA